MWNINPLNKLRQLFKRKPVTDSKAAFDAAVSEFYPTLGKLGTLRNNYRRLIEATVVAQNIITPFTIDKYRKTPKSPIVTVKRASADRAAIRKVLKAAHDKLLSYENEVISLLNDIPAACLKSDEERTETVLREGIVKLKEVTARNQKIIEVHSVYLLALDYLTGLLTLAWKINYEQTGLSESKLFCEVTENEPYVQYLTENDEPKIKLRT